jgi:competence protein ComFC
MSISKRPAYRIYQGIWAGIDLLYPPHCAGCGRKEFRWCGECMSSVVLLNPPYCPKCGMSQLREQVCLGCADQPPKFAALRSWAVFEGALRNAIHKFKYDRDLSLGGTFAEPLCDLLRCLMWPIDLVVPVPLSKKRLIERGYNQAAFLARPIALYFGIPFSDKSLVRVRETHTQVGFNAEQRRQNVGNAFSAKPNMVNNKNILVVDDVTTTGATLDACADALISANAKNVYGLTLARAILI